MTLSGFMIRVPLCNHCTVTSLGIGSLSLHFTLTTGAVEKTVITLLLVEGSVICGTYTVNEQNYLILLTLYIVYIHTY